MCMASDNSGQEQQLCLGAKAADEGRMDAERVAQETMQLHRPNVRVT